METSRRTSAVVVEPAAGAVVASTVLVESSVMAVEEASEDNWDVVGLVEGDTDGTEVLEGLDKKRCARKGEMSLEPARHDKAFGSEASTGDNDPSAL